MKYVIQIGDAYLITRCWGLLGDLDEAIRFDTRKEADAEVEVWDSYPDYHAMGVKAIEDPGA